MLSIEASRARNVEPLEAWTCQRAENLKKKNMCAGVWVTVCIALLLFLLNVSD